MKDYLENVYGLKSQKAEINNLIYWFLNQEEYIKKGYTIPTGLLLHGDPGNGKSLIMTEIEKSLSGNDNVVFKKFKTYYENNLIKDLNDFFNVDDHSKKYILAIDELDLLLGDDNNLFTRALQEKLDGIENKESQNIFVISACNLLPRIPKAIIRTGRFDRKILIADPNEKEIKEFISSLERKLNFNIDKESIDMGVFKIFIGNSYVEINAIINDCLLRFGPSKCNYDNLVFCSKCLENSFEEKNKKINDQVYIHEAGHTVMSLAFGSAFSINKVIVNDDNSGYVSAYSPDLGVSSYQSILADTLISLSGIISEKIITKNPLIGSFSDLNNARHNAYGLINTNGFYGCFRTLPEYESYGQREESNFKRRLNEILIEHLLKRLEKDATKFLKKHVVLIKEIARNLKAKNYLTSREIRTILTDYETKYKLKLEYKKLKITNYVLD